MHCDTLAKEEAIELSDCPYSLPDIPSLFSRFGLHNVDMGLLTLLMTKDAFSWKSTYCLLPNTCGLDGALWNLDTTSGYGPLF